MSSSRAALLCSAYDFIDQAKKERNRSFLQPKYMSQEQCRDCIGGIERELVAWGVCCRRVSQSCGTCHKGNSITRWER